jgi:OmpA-OmpF porin, OOP family
VNGPGTGIVLGSGFGGVPLGVNTGLTKQYDVGAVGVISLGWGFGNGLRVELEGNARNNRVSKLTGTPFPTNSGGNEVTYGAMANVLYDFDIASWTGGQSYVFPYIGVGAGYAWTSYDSLHSYGTNFPFFYKSNDTDGNFAYQAIAGIAYPIPGVLGLSLTAEYRFFGVLDGAKYHGAIDTGFQRSFIETKAATSSTTAFCWVSATPSTRPPRRRRRPLRSPPQPRPRRAPIWCSSIGTEPTSPTAHARSSARRPRTRRASSTRRSR